MPVDLDVLKQSWWSFCTEYKFPVRLLTSPAVSLLRWPNLVSNSKIDPKRNYLQSSAYTRKSYSILHVRYPTSLFPSRINYFHIKWKGQWKTICCGLDRWILKSISSEHITMTFGILTVTICQMILKLIVDLKWFLEQKGCVPEVTMMSCNRKVQHHQIQCGLNLHKIGFNVVPEKSNELFRWDVRDISNQVFYGI